MEVILLAIYALFVWLIFFKFKWLKWTTTAAVIVVTIPIISLAAMLLLLNVYAPSALDVRVINYVVQIVPRVTGRVIEVPVEPNQLVKKGEVLFQGRSQALRIRGPAARGAARHYPGRRRVARWRT